MLFDEGQKEELYRRSGGKCAICDEPVQLADAEADHFPVAWRDGGQTTLENGRIVCKRCHPRGRPPLAAAQDDQ